MNRPRPTAHTRALADTAFAWTCAIATIGFLTTAVVIGANGGGWRITETLIWAVLIGWLLLLTGKTRGQGERGDAVRIPFRRGNDGLTDRQRAKCARRWRNGAGRTPSKDEMNRLRAMTAETHANHPDYRKEWRP